MFKREDEISLPGKLNEPNEDRCGCIDHTAWMIDGATGVTDRVFAARQGETDAAWLAQELHDYFTTFAESYQGNLPGLLQIALQTIRLKFNTLSAGQNPQPYEYPCASLQLCQIDGTELKFAALGDCLTMAQDDAHFFMHGGDPLHHAVDENTINIYRQLRASGADHAKAREGIIPVLRQARNKLNAEGGHGVFNLGQDHFHPLRLAAIPLKPGGQIMMMTDGLYRMCDVYAVYPDDRSLMEAAKMNGLASLGQNLRAIEAAGNVDAHTLRYRCLKQSDDATGLRLSLT